MDYEKKYKEAIYLLKELRPKISDYYREKLDGLFPEITESEDEMIRKAIIEFFELQDDNTTYSFVQKRDIIAWLEKQGESQVNKLQVSDELYERIRNTCACIDDALSSKTLADINDYLSIAERSAQSAFDMIEKQGEYSKWKPTEEQLQTLHAQLNESAVTYPEDVRVLSSLYEDLKKLN